jgi:hypothetical protein
VGRPRWGEREGREGRKGKDEREGRELRKGRDEREGRFGRKATGGSIRVGMGGGGWKEWQGWM